MEDIRKAIKEKLGKFKKDWQAVKDYNEIVRRSKAREQAGIDKVAKDYEDELAAKKKKKKQATLEAEAKAAGRYGNKLRHVFEQSSDK